MAKIGEFQKNRNNENFKVQQESNVHKVQSINIQDQLLNQLRKDKAVVSVELLSGTVVRGEITAFDNYSIILDNDGKQLIYKHGIVLIKWSAT